MVMKRAKTADITAARELVLSADNEGSIYHLKKAILANLGKKVTKGTYDTAKAPKAWQPFVDRAAKLYAEGFGSAIFDAPTRRLAARMIAVQEGNMLKRGEYSDLLASLGRK
jgi:hypothetical protein